MRQLDVPATLSDAGVEPDRFERELRDMSDIAFNDQCTGTNPRMPLVAEIEGIYREAYAPVAATAEKGKRVKAAETGK
jgi:acetaldehyde dehydrogenase/alcohol dehydrogenase